MTRRQAEAMSSSPPWPASLSSQVAAFRSWTKESPTNSEHCRTLLHRHFEVVGHAHRTHWKGKARGELPELPEPRPRRFRRAGRADGHQATDIEPQRAEVDDETGHVLRLGAVLLRLAADIDLDEDDGVGCPLGDLLAGRHPVDGLPQVHVGGDLPHLVPLDA